MAKATTTENPSSMDRRNNRKSGRLAGRPRRNGAGRKAAMTRMGIQRITAFASRLPRCAQTT